MAQGQHEAIVSDLPDNWESQDSYASWDDAIQEMRIRRDRIDDAATKRADELFDCLRIILAHSPHGAWPTARKLVEEIEEEGRQ